MNLRLFKATLETLAASFALAAACGYAAAPVKRFDNGAMFSAGLNRGAVVSDSDGFRMAGEGPLLERVALHLAPQPSMPEGYSPFASKSYASAGEGLDGQPPFIQYAVRLYPIENGGGGRGGSEGATRLLPITPSARTGRDVAQIEPLAAAKKVSLPEPGNWAMVLAGLLGVCAIARRRMSV